MKSILVVDDERLILDVLCSIVAANGYNVVGKATTGIEAVRQSLFLRPGFVVMDIVMPALDGIEATRQILKELPKTKIIICTAYLEGELQEAALSGAHGLVAKPFETELLLDVLNEVGNGKMSFPRGPGPDQAEIRRDKRPLPSLLEILSTRERQILTLLSEGKTSLETARLLGLRRTTVRKYLRQIRTKLGGDRAPDLKELARSL